MWAGASIISILRGDGRIDIFIEIEFNAWHKFTREEISVLLC